MRTFLTLAVILTLVSAVPAVAEDGHVPQTTLERLGLGDMQVVADDAGMKVRGKTGLAAAMGRSVISGVLLSPDTKNYIIGGSSNLGYTNAELAGFIDPFAMQTQMSFLNLNLNVMTGTPFSAVIMGGAGGSSIGVFR